MALYFPDLANIIAVIITWAIGVVLLLTGTGVGLTLPTLVSAAVSVVPPNRFATGSGIVKALLRAKERNVDVRLIADKTTACERASDREHGIITN